MNKHLVLRVGSSIEILSKSKMSECLVNELKDIFIMENVLMLIQIKTHLNIKAVELIKVLHGLEEDFIILY